MTDTYPKQRSLAIVTFTDGEVQSYEISAGSSIAGYLMRRAGETGVLTLRDDTSRTAMCIPLNLIRNVQFTPAPDNTQAEYLRQQAVVETLKETL